MRPVAPFIHILPPIHFIALTPTHSQQRYQTNQMPSPQQYQAPANKASKIIDLTLDDDDDDDDECKPEVPNSTPPLSPPFLPAKISLIHLPPPPPLCL